MGTLYFSGSMWEKANDVRINRFEVYQDIELVNIIDRMFNNLALRGLLSLLGAFLISLAVGINYLWGIITIYGTSYFRIMMWNKSLTEDSTDIVFPLMLLGQVLSSLL